MIEMSRKEAMECIEAIHVQMFNSGNSKWTKACDMAIEALKNIQVLDKIPQNYLYDAETEHCLVYRHKYTGKEIHILKPTDLFILERPNGEWIYHAEWYSDGECAYECSRCGMGADVDYNFCPNCEKHFFGKRPTECDCGFKHFTQEERIEFLEDAVTELTQKLNDLSVLVGNLVNHWLGR